MRRILLGTMLFAAISLLPTAARASTLTITLDQVFSGNTPNSSSPYLIATFLDGANCIGGACAAGTVQLLLTSSLEAAGEFVTEWDFNSLVLPLTITQVNGPTASISTGSNAFQADGDGLYDISIVFLSGPPSARMDGADTALFTIVGSGITVSTFNTLSAPGGNAGGPFHSAAHIQGISPNCSGWVGDSAAGSPGSPSGPCGAVPDGGTTLSLLGLAVAGLGVVRRYMNS